MHLKDGEIRAFVDGEGSRENRANVEAHLAACPACSQRQMQIMTTAETAAGRLVAIAPTQIDETIPVSQAQKRFSALVTEKEKYQMQNLWSVRYRAAIIAAGLVFVLLVSMAFAPVRAIANSFLGLFRVQQIEVVEVDPGYLPEQLGSSYQLQYFMSNDVHFEHQGEDQVVGSAEEAGSLAGIPVRTPPGMNGTQQLVVTAPVQISFTVNLALVQAVLDEIGRGDIRLPEEIDGAQVTVDMPASVSASYGDCVTDGQGSYPEGFDPDDPALTLTPACTTLVQMRSPQVNAPQGLDLKQLGQAYLQLVGMAPEDAIQYSQNIDWATTLVVPIPVYDASYRQVAVDGVQGTLILSDQGDYGQQYMLIWIKGGIVYVLTGPGGPDTAVRLADSIR